MALTNDHIIKSISNHLDFPKTESAILFGSILEIIMNTLKNGESVLINGFGKFNLNEKNNRKGREPAAGGDLMLGARRVAPLNAPVC